MSTLVVLAFVSMGTYFINHQLGGIMATLAELNVKMDEVAAGVDALENSIAELKAQVAAGGVVTQEQLDALHAKATAIGDDIKDTSDQG